MRPFATIFSAVLLCGLLAVVIANGQDGEPALAPAPEAASPDADTPTGEPAAERFVPDQHTRPWDQPQRGRPVRTVYADRVVLEGPTCRIVIDATGDQPGIQIESRASGEKACVYLTRAGRAVVGVATPARKDIAAGLWADRTGGVVQLSGSRGVHVFSGPELERYRYGDR